MAYVEVLVVGVDQWVICNVLRPGKVLFGAAAIQIGIGHDGHGWKIYRDR